MRRLKYYFMQISREYDTPGWISQSKQSIPICDGQAIWRPENTGDVAAVVRSHMSGSIPLEWTIQQTTETMPLALKQ